MTTTSKTVLTFNVPVVEDTTRVPHTDRRWAQFECAMLSQFGGFTRGHDVSGVWKAPNGDVIRDVSRVYELDVDADNVESAKAFLVTVCARFDQQCLRVSVRGEASYLARESAPRFERFGLTD